MFLLFTVAALGAGKPQPLRSDAEIEGEFRTRLSRSKLASDGIAIKARGGVATLTGRVNIMQHKGAATRMAKSSGAREVRNQIEITDAARQKALEKLKAGRLRAEATGVATAKSTTSAAPPAAAPASRSSVRSTSTSAPSAPPPATTASAPAAASGSPGPPPVRRAAVKH